MPRYRLLLPTCLLLVTPARADTPLSDALGDPLPAAALARLGSVRWRHGDSVAALAFSADGKFLASAGGADSSRAAVHLWSAATGQRLRELHEPFATCVAFAPGGKVLITGSGVGAVRLWPLQGGEPRKLLADLGKVNAVTVSPDGRRVAAAGANGAVGQWDAATGEAFPPCTGHKGEVLAVAYSPDGKLLASAGADQTVRLWRVSTLTELDQLHPPQTTRGLAFSRDSKSLLTAGDAGKVQVWDLDAGKELHAFEAHKGGVLALALSADAKALLTSGRDTVRLWQLEKSKEIRSLPQTPGACGAIAMSPDGKLAAAGEGPVVRVWDVTEGKQLPLARGPLGAVTTVAASLSGKVLVTASLDGTVRVWDPDSTKELRQCGHSPADTVEAPRLALAPDGKTLVTGGPAGGLTLWDVETGRELRPVLGPPDDPARCVAFAPDGRALAVGHVKHHIRLHDVATGAQRFVLEGHTDWVTALAFSPDGKTLASGSHDDTVRLWDVTTGKLLRTLGKAGEVTALAFSPLGRALATGGRDGLISVWDLDAGKDVRQAQGHPNAVYSLAFAPDGRTLASGGHDQTVRLWETATSRELLRLAGHNGAVRSVAFVGDGRTLASGGQDTTVLLWDVTGLRTGARPAGHLERSELDKLWADLASDDGPRGYRALWTLIGSPKQSVPYLQEQVQYLVGVDAERIDKLIAELDDDEFAVRERAMVLLEQLGPLAATAMRKALANPPSQEVRVRIQQLMERQPGPATWPQERQRVLRIVEVLEKAGTPAARTLLESLARTTAEPELVQAAKTALGRLGGHPNIKGAKSPE
jgi:WD40 repeat protein